MTNQQIIDNHNARIDAYKEKFNLDDALHSILLDSYCEGVERELMKDLKGGEKWWYKWVIPGHIV